MIIDLAQLTMNFDRCYALRIQKLYHRLHFKSVDARMRAPIFNRCNDATVRTQEVLLVHASCDVITLSRRPYTHSLRAINDLISARKVGNLLCGCPRMISHHHFWLHSPMRAFASCIVLFHTPLSFTSRAHPFIPHFLMSSCTESHRLFFGLPHFLFPPN